MKHIFQIAVNTNKLSSHLFYKKLTIIIIIFLNFDLARKRKQTPAPFRSTGQDSPKPPAWSRVFHITPSGGGGNNQNPVKFLIFYSLH
jgi:hypothetical protein